MRDHAHLAYGCLIPIPAIGDRGDSARKEASGYIVRVLRGGRFYCCARVPTEIPLLSAGIARHCNQASSRDSTS